MPHRERIFDAVYKAYARKMDMIAEIAYPVLHQVFEEQSNAHERIFP